MRTTPGTTDALHEAWSTHLSNFPWQFFVTLTHRQARSPNQFEAMFKNSYIRKLARSAQAPVEWFFVVEHGEGVRTHAHALLLSRGLLDARTLAWAWRFGHAQIGRYLHDGNVASYVSKSLARSDAHYDVSAKLSGWKDRQRSPRLA